MSRYVPKGVSICPKERKSVSIYVLKSEKCLYLDHGQDQGQDQNQGQDQDHKPEDTKA